MSLVLRPLSQLLLRTAAPRAPTCSQAAAKLVSNHSSWCRRRQSAVRRLSVTSRGRCLLQEHVSGEEGSLSEDELHLSDSCVMRLQKVREEEPGVMLRVTVDGGGCSGFQYNIEFDTKVNSDDKVFERDGVSVVVDSLSLGLLGGCTVDYHTELIRSGFRITGNPKAESSCSCGVSFAPK